MQERYQRPEVYDLKTKWKLFYWDYTSTPRRKRTKTWSKSSVPSRREAQRLADQFMDQANARNNQPHLFSGEEGTLQDLHDKCLDLTWPHLKNSSRKQYKEHFKTHLLPAFGNVKLRKLTLMQLQGYFNSLLPGRGSKTVRLIHATLRAALNEAIRWGMLEKNPAVGVRLPKNRAVKPPVLLLLTQIRRVLELVKEPTRSLLLLIVFASMRVGEVLALRWKDILGDRIIIDERVYDGEFDDTKTGAGEREVPFDRYGVILGAVQEMWNRNAKFRKPGDLIFANKAGNPLDRHNLLHRHLKPAIKELGLPPETDFRSFRTMHASLMRRMGGRLEVARDNMGHAGSTGSITLDVYSKTWWKERVDAVTRVVEAVLTEPDNEEDKRIVIPQSSDSKGEEGAEWVPFWVPQAIESNQK